MAKASAWLALAFGVFLAVAEAARNWPNRQWWPFWVVDYIAAGLLIVGAALVLRGARGGVRWLAGAWGFACAMFWMSFFGHLGDALAAVETAPRERMLMLIIGAMFVLTILGFTTSLSARDSKAD